VVNGFFRIQLRLHPAKLRHLALPAAPLQSFFSAAPKRATICATMKAKYFSYLSLAVWLCLFSGKANAETFEIHPPNSESCDEEFENLANKLKPGDQLILHDGVYSQGCRRAITAKGEADKPIVIRAADGAAPTN